MAKKQKFGKFVLLEETDTVGLGSEFRAAKLGSTGLEKIVSLLRLSQALSSHADVAKAIMEQTKIAAALQNPNIVKIFGIGKVDWAYYISSEFIEGKNLKAILQRCRQERFPFSTDHALLIASKVCTALEFAHARRTDAGARYFHGLLAPASVLVSYEGEVRTRGFGYWPAHVREAGGIAADELPYLSPEQAAGGNGDPRSDIFAVGAILFETLTGQALPGRDADVGAVLAQARLQSASGEDDALPKPLAEILHRALAREPGGRYGEVQELRKAIDTLLFSGDFTPTTFNLAFFMHSLFREDIERESKLLKEEKEASYVEYLTEDTKPARTGTGTVKIDTGEFTAPPPPAAPAEAATVITAPPAAHAHATPPPAAHAPAAEHAAAHAPSRDAADSLTFHKDAGKKSSLPLVAGIVLLLAAGGAGAFFYLRSSSSAPPPAPANTPPTLSPEAAAALQRVKELEARLKAIEDEKAQAEAQAADEAKRKMEAQAKARGQAIDPAALAKAQEEAARKARAEQERKAEEERKRLEAEKRAEEERLAEEQRRAEEQRKAEEAARQAEAARAAAAATPTPTPPPVTQPAIRPGTLVNISDPGVTPPAVEKQPQIVYPPLALRQGIEGDVELNALVDEKGNVADVQVVRGAGGKAGLNEAAVENVKRRKYKPATKDGVPVKVWVPVRVQFKLPR